MALVRHFGKPTLFVTFTANPRWGDIKNNITANLEATDRPDRIVKTFYRKLKRLIHLIKIGRVFRPYTARIHIIEYQKRGLPHAYILIFYLNRHAFSTIEQIDNLIFAKFPSAELDRDRKLT